jgi:hypothetical protein
VTGWVFSASSLVPLVSAIYGAKQHRCIDE